MNIIKHTFAFSWALSATIVYVAYGLMLHFMPEMYNNLYAQLLHLQGANLIGAVSTHALAISAVQVFIMNFVGAFLFSLMYNWCVGCCCSKN